MKRYIKSSEQTDADWELQFILEKLPEKCRDYINEIVEFRSTYHPYSDGEITTKLIGYVQALEDAGIINDSESYDVLDIILKWH